MRQYLFLVLVLSGITLYAGIIEVDSLLGWSPEQDLPEPSFVTKEDRATWQRDEARRIEWQSTDTFNPDGTWKYADPNSAAHFRAQLEYLDNHAIVEGR